MYTCIPIPKGLTYGRNQSLIVTEIRVLKKIGVLVEIQLSGLDYWIYCYPLSHLSHHLNPLVTLMLLLNFFTITIFLLLPIVIIIIITINLFNFNTHSSFLYHPLVYKSSTAINRCMYHICLDFDGIN